MTKKTIIERRAARNEAQAKAERSAAKWNETVRKLRLEITTREARGRETKALARARQSLRRAEARAEAAARQVKALADKARRRAAEAEAIARRFGAMAKTAPAVMERWKKERKEEPKKVEKRVRQINRRVTKDLHQRVGREEWHHHLGGGRRATAAALPVEAETFPSGPIIPYKPPQLAAPERAGLQPGDFRLVLPAATCDHVDRSRPREWKADYVGKRLADAHSVLRRLPMVTRPKEFGANWPEYIHQGVELAYQAGAGTLHMNRHRFIGGTSADDVARMNQALAWPMEFLSDRPDLARAVNEWAFWRLLDGDALDPLSADALKIIAGSLNARKVPVT